MKLLGLNSPEIFIILVILLSILGPKRIEIGFSLFKKLLKFLLSKDEDQSITNSEVKAEEAVEGEVKEELVKAEEAVEGEVKEELVESEVKAEEAVEGEVKEELVKAEEAVEGEVKEELVESEVKAEEAVEGEVKEEKTEPKVKSIKPKKRKVKDEIIDVEVDSDN